MLINKYCSKNYSELSDSGIGLLDKKLKWVNQNKDELNKMIDYEHDFNMDFFGFKTLKGLPSKDPQTKKIYERPQDMWLRVASFLNMGNLEKTKLTYDLMSTGFYTHASPTLYNSGTKRPQLSSCFLIGTEDSIAGITKTWTDVSMISKWAVVLEFMLVIFVLRIVSSEELMDHLPVLFLCYKFIIG